MRILESAVLGFTGQVLGATIWGQQFLGSRFHLTQPAHVTAVGGHLAADYAGTLFAAIVRLSSPMGLPTFAPHAIESAALASTLFTPPRPSGDVLLPLSADLGPGDYALVFGGADSAVGFFPFGARGTGVMPLNNVSFPTSSYILGDAVRWTNDPTRGARFVVVGDVSAPSAPTGLNVS
jgi:hypothetical protein